MTYNINAGYAVPSANATAFMAAQPTAGNAFQSIIYRNALRCFQAQIKYYNDYALRILWDFTSRGMYGVVGNNIFGQPFGAGRNWSATSEKAGYSVYNLNTDIVEQYYRTDDGVNTVILTLDAEYPQGILIDTLAFLNTNLSTSSTITWQRSTTSDFSVVDSKTIQATKTNCYWIAPELPTKLYRFHRFIISDPTKTAANSFISIGTIIAGDSFIMTGGEDIIDNILFAYQEYADKIETEGYSNITNSRAIKRIATIDFRNILYDGNNYPYLREIINTHRTSLKTLWIPTPSSSDQTITDRFSVFGKLASMPQESHNYKGPTAQYIDFTCEVNESL